MLNDFTLTQYRNLLLTLKERGYSFYTFESWRLNKPQKPFVVLRHDVDLKAKNSYKVAKIENQLGIKSTYYFRLVSSSNKPEIIRKIVELGHEVGYHYEDLSLCKGNYNRALLHFNDTLEYFRTYYPVQTICMHGSPTSKWDNKNIWVNKSYKDFGIIGEPYFDFLSNTDFLYFTDTARMWDGDRFNVRDKASDSGMKHDKLYKIHTTKDLIRWVNMKDSDFGIMITTHPQRWTNNVFLWIQELLLQQFKNIIKRYFFVNKRK